MQGVGGSYRKAAVGALRRVAVLGVGHRGTVHRDPHVVIVNGHRPVEVKQRYVTSA